MFFFQIPLESATKRQTWEATGAKKTCVFLLYFTTPIIKLSLSFSTCRHFLSGFLLEALLKASECNNEGLCSFYSHHVWQDNFEIQQRFRMYFPGRFGRFRCGLIPRGLIEGLECCGKFFQLNPGLGIGAIFLGAFCCSFHGGYKLNFGRKTGPRGD